RASSRPRPEPQKGTTSMADITYRFNREDIVEGISTIQQTYSTLSSDLQNCNSTVDNVTADWVGQDKDEAEGHRAQWNQAATRIHDCLLNAQQSLTNILDNYDAQEASTASAWQY